MLGVGVKYISRRKARKVWQKELLDDVLIEVGNAVMIFKAPNMSNHMMSRITLVIGKSKILMHLLDMQELAINTFTIPRADIIEMNRNGVEVTINTTKGGEYRLTGFDPLEPLLSGLGMYP